MVYMPQGLREELVSSVSEGLGAVGGHKCGSFCHLQGGPPEQGRPLGQWRRPHLGL